MYAHYMILATAIAIAFYSDVTRAIISNRLTGAVTVLAFALNITIGGIAGFISSLIAFAISFALLLALYVCKAVGAGDVKLFGAIGALMGLEFSLYSMIYALLYAGLIGVVMLLLRRRLLSTMARLYRWFNWSIASRQFKWSHDSHEQQMLTFPFMFAVAPAVVTTTYHLML